MKTAAPLFYYRGKNNGKRRGDIAVAWLVSKHRILCVKWRVASLEKRYYGRYRIVFYWKGNAAISCSGSYLRERPVSREPIC